jgi:hypothetical protein
MIFSLYDNLLGHRTKIPKMCPICGEEVHTIQFKNYEQKKYTWNTIGFLTDIIPIDRRKNLQW